MASCLIDGALCEEVATAEEPVVYSWVFYREALNDAWIEYAQNSMYITGKSICDTV